MDQTFIENLIKIGVSILVGGVIGAEREYQDKAAGFRTIILITLGSALFTIFSLSMDAGFTQTRIAANIVTGIGFLGAGAIVRDGGRIAGLTDRGHYLALHGPRHGDRRRPDLFCIGSHHGYASGSALFSPPRKPH